MSDPVVSDLTVAEAPPFEFETTFVDRLGGLYQRWEPEPAPDPTLVVANDDLAAELGIDPELLRTPAVVAALAGSTVPAGAVPVAQAYAGHQFGHYSPRLGDGRALLLGEIVDVRGRRRDLHLKGSGATPFARGGDGKATLGPMLREYVIGEAMHALGIPTTRALAVVTTGERVMRDTPQPGAVLARVAASHLRVGTFQYAAATGDVDLLRRLTDYAIERHHPQAAESLTPALALFDAVVEAQASLVAQWMHVGFVHGVMNTDNTTISGETIDYGPCAFMDAFDPATVFSSIDHAGRYAYGNQPTITVWNLARMAEALLALIDTDAGAAVAAANEVLETFPDRYRAHRRRGVLLKLGLRSEAPDDDSVIADLFALLQAQRADHTSAFRWLSSVVRGTQPDVPAPLPDRAAFDTWATRWLGRIDAEGRGRHQVADEMDQVNPVYVPRNHLVEDALEAAVGGDLSPFERLVDVVRRPFEERPGLDAYTAPAPASSGPYRTFCGT